MINIMCISQIPFSSSSGSKPANTSVDLTKYGIDRRPSLELAIAREFTFGQTQDKFQAAAIDLLSNWKPRVADDNLRNSQTSDDSLHGSRDKSDIKLTCSFCDSTCDSPVDLNVHMEQYHRYNCRLCQKSFSTGSGLYSHNRLQHGRGTDLLACNICGKKCLSKARLTIHERSHSESRMFQCLQCNRSYKHKYSLDGHNCLGPNDSNQ